MPALCRSSTKNGAPCRSRAKHTIYCGRHAPQAHDDVLRIQRWWRRVRCVRTARLRGAAFWMRSACENTEDVCTFDPITDIPAAYFVSYHEPQTDKWWGFDVRTLRRLFLTKNFANPYTTHTLSPEFIARAQRLISLYRRDMDDEDATVTEATTHTQTCVDVCVDMGVIGYHVDPQWILSLTRQELMRVCYDFKDMVYYRAGLSHTDIAHIFGQDTWHMYCMFSNIQRQTTAAIVTTLCAAVRKMFREGVEAQHREQGTLLFLCALGGVSENVRAAHPFVMHV